MQSEACAISWMLWGSSAPDEIAAVYHQVNQIFSSFSYYPEQEWPQHRFRPPDGHKVFGGWRDTETVAFVFLLNNPGASAPAGTAPLMLSYDGQRSTLTPFMPQIRKLKKDLARKNGRKTTDKQLQMRLEKAHTSKSLVRLMALMAPITAIINALALYLRKVAPPAIDAAWLSETYQIVLPLVYISALALLLIFTIICILYVCKYGLLLLRRL